MRKIVICDDEKIMRDQLKDYLSRMDLTGQLFSVEECSNASELLAKVEKADIILLDIGLEGLSGMDAAQMLREKKQDVCIIFISSLVEYALEGYKVRAFGFLKKPVSFASFRQELEDALRYTNIHKGSQITLKKGGQTLCFNCKDIYYFEVQGHNTILSLKNKKIDFFTNLNDIQETVDDECFYRCHKSFLINMRHVKAIDKNDIIMENGIIIPLSKHRHKDFMSAFSYYTGASV